MRVVFTCASGDVTQSIPEIGDDVWLLALDGSVSRSGVCVMSAGGRLGFVCAAIRGSTETPIEYKLALKKLLTEILTRYDIRRAAYEEPFIGYVGDVKALYLIASLLEEICVEFSLPVTVYGVNNKRWKRRFLGTKLQGGREIQKKLVYDKAVAAYPGLASCKDDETDAFGLASYLARCVRDDTLDSMVSKGRARKFQYNITILGGRVGTDAAVKIVGKPRKDGIITAEISARRSFDDTVYDMMRGKDAILLLWFKTGKFGNILLANDAGNLVGEHEVLSAVVTRRARDVKRDVRRVTA